MFAHSQNQNYVKRAFECFFGLLPSTSVSLRSDIKWSLYFFPSVTPPPPAPTPQPPLLLPYTTLFLSLAGAATSIIFVTTNTCLSQQKLWQKTYFVTTYTCLWWQVSLCKKKLSRQAYICCSSRRVLLRQTSVCHNKNYICGSSCQWYISHSYYSCCSNRWMYSLKCCCYNGE